MEGEEGEETEKNELIYTALETEPKNLGTSIE